MIRTVRVFRGDETKTSIIAWLPKQLPNGVNYSEYLTSHKDWTLRSGEKAEMIKVLCDPKEPKQRDVRDALRKDLGQLVVEVEYEDLYGNKMPTMKRPLTYFSRTDHENSSTIEVA